MKNYTLLLCGALSALFLTQCDTEFDDGSVSPKSDNESYYSLTDSENTTGEQYEDYGENPFISAAEQPVSTFSIDADGGSYANTRRFLFYGQNPPEASVRIEEFINYFTFNYDEPSGDENVSLNSEVSTCPWNTSHYLMRIGMKGKTIPKDELPNSNYVFLIDVSGSMDSEDKLGILKTGFKTMVDNLKEQDRIAIVTYSGQAGVLLESTYGDQKTDIKAAIDQLGAGGSTAGAEGILTAYEIAEENFIPGGNNRVILGTDGDFNVGPSSRDEIIALIEEKRETGIYLTVLGVGSGNLNDAMLEQAANKGNGNYEYIDNAQEVQKVFVEEKGKLYTVAKDAKIQITFNKTLIDQYRLIGYENRALNNEDFENDTVDAGEIGSGQTITALYEIVFNLGVSSEKCALFDFRYKKPNETDSRLITQTVKNDPVKIASASENMRFAASISAFGLIMKQSEYIGFANKQMVLDLSEGSISFDPYGYKREYVDIVTNWSE